MNPEEKRDEMIEKKTKQNKTKKPIERGKGQEKGK